MKLTKTRRKAGARNLLFLAAAVTSAQLSPSAFAQTTWYFTQPYGNWSQGYGTYWFGNGGFGGPPAAGDTAYISAVFQSSPNFGSVVTYDYNYTTAAPLNELVIDGQYGEQLNQGADTLSTNTEIVGQTYSGTYTQSGGVNNVGYLYLGLQAGSSGNYQISANASLTANIIYVNPSSSITQTGGTVTAGSLSLGSNGSYLLNPSSTASLNAQSLFFNGTTGATATFTQNGGTVQTSNLQMDNASYTMTGGTLSNTSFYGQAIIGAEGTIATFTQSGGTNSTPTLVLGQYQPAQSEGAQGTYTLSNTGVLTTKTVLLGSSYSASHGFINVQGGSMTIANQLQVSFLSYINVSAGSVTLGSAATPGSFQLDGSVLLTGGSMTVTGVTQNDGGTDVKGSGFAQAGGISRFTEIIGAGDVSVGDTLPYAGYVDSYASFMSIGQIQQRNLFISQQGTVQITGGNPNSVNSLSIDLGSGRLDLTNTKLLINYAQADNPADPISSIAAYIRSGYAGGAWTGPGIISTSAQANSGSYGIGYADSADPGNPAGLSSGQIEIKYTLLGDANLDGKVNGTDFSLMAASFNQSGKSWDQGDFNYDGAVNGSDFLLLANNFNKFASQSAVSAADLAALDSFAAGNAFFANIPEPTCAALMTLATFGILSTRKPRISRPQPKGLPDL